jgi:hypothetical protein
VLPIGTSTALFVQVTIIVIAPEKGGETVPERDESGRWEVRRANKGMSGVID